MEKSDYIEEEQLNIAEIWELEEDGWLAVLMNKEISERDKAFNEMVCIARDCLDLDDITERQDEIIHEMCNEFIDKLRDTIK